MREVILESRFKKYFLVFDIPIIPTLPNSFNVYRISFNSLSLSLSTSSNATTQGLCLIFNFSPEILAM